MITNHFVLPLGVSSSVTEQSERLVYSSHTPPTSSQVNTYQLSSTTMPLPLCKFSLLVSCNDGCKMEKEDGHLYLFEGSVMSHIPLDSLILLVKRITTDFVLCLTHKPTFSWSASPLHRLPRSKTSRKSGSQKSIIIVPVCFRSSSLVSLGPARRDRFN